jgi:glycerate 2-kinase
VSASSAVSPATRARLGRVIDAAIAAADPDPAIRRLLRVDGDTLIAGDDQYRLNDFDHVTVVGAGKASAGMAATVGAALGDRVSGGFVVVKDGHRQPAGRVEVVEAAHPVPDERGARAAARIHALLKSAGARDLVIAVLSGGGSALLPAPAAGISLAELGQTTNRLLRAGATINQLNAVRKHLSLVQGGRLAVAAAPATVLVLAVSDVLGNPLDVIASGPFAPDPSSFEDALAVLAGFDLLDSVPEAVVEHLRAGARGEFADTPGAGDPAFARVRHVIVADLPVAAAAAARQARQEGFRVRAESLQIEGEAREFAVDLAAAARALAADAPPQMTIYGGETTVTVRGDGRGGRCQEIALAAALGIEGVTGIGILAAGTDGTDGPTDAAGALVDGDSIARGQAAGLDARAMLEDNDSYDFLKASGDLLITGPTGTNVNDLMIAFSEGPAP